MTAPNVIAFVILAAMVAIVATTPAPEPHKFGGISGVVYPVPSVPIGYPVPVAPIYQPVPVPVPVAVAAPVPVYGGFYG